MNTSGRRLPRQPGSQPRHRASRQEPEARGGDSEEQRGNAAALGATGLLHLQSVAGNQAVTRLMAETDPAGRSGGEHVQRLIQLGDKLYFNSAAIVRQLPGKKDAKLELSQWIKNTVDLMKKEPIDKENSYAIPGMGLDGTEADALTAKLNTGSLIYNYSSPYAMNTFLTGLQSGVAEDTTPMLHPKDMLDEKRDLTSKYDKGKACVLQALINLGVKNPGLESGEQESGEAWHSYYFSRDIMYDDDTVLYGIYTGFGLRMVWNKRCLWKDLDPRVIVPGEYVFSTPGHNFAVVVNRDDRREARYEPKDKPQNIVSAYQPERSISYVWRLG